MTLGFDCLECGFKETATQNKTNINLCPTCGNEVTEITGDISGPGTQYTITYFDMKTGSEKMKKLAAGDIEHAYRQIKKQTSRNIQIKKINIIN